MAVANGPLFVLWFRFLYARFFYKFANSAHGKTSAMPKVDKPVTMVLVIVVVIAMILLLQFAFS